MKPPVQYRQGDVLLVRVAKPFDLATMRKVKRGKRGIVLAEGEATGHAHVIDEPEGVALFRRNGARLLEVTRPATLRHEEHGAIILEPGQYQVVRQREYDPWKRRQQRTVGD